MTRNEISSVSWYRIDYSVKFTPDILHIMTKILSLVNQKGGVGKTTSSVNIAVSMAAAEIRTLLIDFDPQANATTGVSNLIKKNNHTIYDVLMRGININKALISTQFDHLDVIISENDLVGAEIELVNVMAREYQLKSLIKKLKRKYEYIIVDCPPSLGLLTINALAASNAVLIPIQCEYYALEGLGQLLNTIRLVQKHINPKLSIAGVLLTMYDSRLNLSKEVADEVREYFEEKLFNTVIHRNVRLGEAPSFGKPALLYDANSTGAQNYLSLVEELLNRVK